MGHYDLDGILHIVALQDCGVYVPTNELTEVDKDDIRDKLSLLHKAGFVHCDAAHRNFVRSSVGEWKIVDFGRTKRSEDEELRKKDFADLEESWELE